MGMTKNIRIKRFSEIEIKVLSFPKLNQKFSLLLP